MTREEIAAVTPPIAQKKEYQFEIHGQTLSDPYHWMRDPAYPEVKDPEVIAHLEAENAYCDRCFADLQPLRAKLIDEFKGRIVQDDQSVPARWGSFYYHWKFEEGADYRQWYRSTSPSGRSQLILDEAARAIASGGNFFNVRMMDVSSDEDQLLWSEDCNGSERYVIYTRNLANKTVEQAYVSDTSGVAFWITGQDAFLYVELNDQLRPFRVRQHILGQKQEMDAVIFEEDDPAFYVSISKSLSGEYFFIRTGDHITTEIRLVYTAKPLDESVVVSPRRTGHDYSISHSGKYFYIVTNDTHKNFRLVSVPVDDCSEDKWTELVPPSDNMYIQAHLAFQKFIAIEGRIDGNDFLSILDITTGKKHDVSFPEQNFSVNLGENRVFASNEVRLSYESLITPPTIYDYDAFSQKLSQKKTLVMPSGYDKSRYKTEKIWAKAADGTQIPVSIVYAENAPSRQKSGLHLYAYGAYGIGISPRFSANRLSLLDRGIIYAIAHVRGGDEMGYQWYEDGKLSKRTNAFFDFITVADHLVDQGYCERGRISISGGSAGGSLIGFVLNERPQNWIAAVAHVPFVDILNTMLDDQLPLTPMEWPEWGNPIHDRSAFETILSYSPYENVKPQNYPVTFVTAGLFDPRVTYWEPAKWVAKLRENNLSAYTIMLKTHMGAGHQGASGRFSYLDELADEYAFILNAFNPRAQSPDF